MRSIAEIDRDFAGMHDNCERQSHGCNYPTCKCSRKGAVPAPKQTVLTFNISTLRPEDFIVINECNGDRWRGTKDGTFVRVTGFAPAKDAECATGCVRAGGVAGGGEPEFPVRDFTIEFPDWATIDLDVGGQDALKDALLSIPGAEEVMVHAGGWVRFVSDLSEVEVKSKQVADVCGRFAAGVKEDGNGRR